MRRMCNILGTVVALAAAVLALFRSRWSAVRSSRTAHMAALGAGVLCLAAAAFCWESPVAATESQGDVQVAGHPEGGRRANAAALVKADLEAFEARWAEAQRQAAARRDESRRALEAMERPEPRRRPVKRWQWESPAETRARLWNVPETESETATATALLRICFSEADGNEADCVGIFQVLRNIRSRQCNRRRINLITECDADGETLLSVMRRAQRYATGTVPPRSRRARWIAEMELTCLQPVSYPGSERQWARMYSRPCSRTSDLVQRMVAGREVEPVITGFRAITWGGRCEEASGACDDPLACARGLARIPETGTLNAFWHRPAPGYVDPICASM